jgi:hypothetical protein
MPDLGLKSGVCGAAGGIDACADCPRGGRFANARDGDSESESAGGFDGLLLRILGALGYRARITLQKAKPAA